jgi:vancomycin permeability regulator SanA
MTTPHVPRRQLLVSVLALVAALPIAASGQAPSVAGRAPRVAVILGNAPTATDEPKPAQAARCLKAFELYRKGTVDKLVVTGGFTVDYISEARMMKIALVTFGVPPGDIVEDEMSATTIENGVYSARVFDQQHWPKKAVVVSQAFHLPRASGNFKDVGFEVETATAADTVSGVDDFALVPDMKAEGAPQVEASDLIVVYEPYASLEPMDWPTPQLAHRLRVAASLFHRKVAPGIVLFNDRYTRGSVNLAQMMKIALVSLGVPAGSVRAVKRGEYRRLGDLAAGLGDTSAVVLTTAKAASATRTGAPPPPPQGVALQGPPPQPGAALPGAAAGAPPPGGLPVGGSPPPLPARWKVIAID